MLSEGGGGGGRRSATMPPKKSRTLTGSLSTMSSSSVWERILSEVIGILVLIGTFPYYRLFHFNTLQPIRRIAKCASDPSQSRRLARLLFQWRSRKLSELQYISIASAVMAAANIGSFSWTGVPDAYWLSSAMWNASLIFSIVGILVSSQQISVLDLLGPPSSPSPASHSLPIGGFGGGASASFNVRSPSFRLDKSRVDRFLPVMLTVASQKATRASSRGDLPSRAVVWRPRWKMVFVWQCPIMFLTYSVFTYLTGLTIYVCSPLINGQYDAASYATAFVFIGVAIVSLGIFVFVSFWIYRYVDLEGAADDMEEDLDTFRLPRVNSGTQTKDSSFRAASPTSFVQRRETNFLESSPERFD